MRFYLFLLPVFLLTVYPQTTQATVIHVPGDSTTIQGGINGAMDGDTVMVDIGTYYEHDIDFIGKAITVMSTHPEDTLVVNATIVDAGASGSVFTFNSGEDSTSILTGLTITGGLATAGGGIFCQASSPLISDCVIVDNEATGSRPNGGGGIYCEESFIQVRDCKISLNFAHRGGGIKSHNSSPTIQNCTIRDNVTEGDSGGGINFTESSNVVVQNCTIIDNVSGVGAGGITCSGGSEYWILNTVIVGNTAAIQGGGFHSRGSAQPTLENCTISGNSASSGDGIMNVGTTPDIFNCIIWDNGTEEIGNSAGGNPTITYSDVKGGWTGKGNIDADPLFLDSENDDYHLQLDSPCIDAGNPAILDACRPPGLGEERSDMGAYGGEENCGWLPPITIANFEANPTSGKRPLTVNFTDLSSGSITSWFWFFGDGDSSSVQNPTHTYNDTGLFTVSLTVAGPYGTDDTTMVDLIHVTEPPAMYLTVIPDTTAFPRGGELGFHVTATNNTQGTLSVEAWSDVTLPMGRLISPFGGPLPVNFGPGHTLEMHVSQSIPPIAPLGGPYLYCVIFGSFPDSILVQDCFEFDVVLGAD